MPCCTSLRVTGWHFTHSCRITGADSCMLLQRPQYRCQGSELAALQVTASVAHTSLSARHKCMGDHGLFTLHINLAEKLGTGFTHTLAPLPNNHPAQPGAPKYRTLPHLHHPPTFLTCNLAILWAKFSDLCTIFQAEKTRQAPGTMQQVTHKQDGEPPNVAPPPSSPHRGHRCWKRC